jgi:hypothetical protein
MFAARRLELILRAHELCLPGNYFPVFYTLEFYPQSKNVKCFSLSGTFYASHSLWDEKRSKKMRTLWTIVFLGLILAAGLWAYQANMNENIDIPTAEQVAEQTGMDEAQMPDIMPSAGQAQTEEGQGSDQEQMMLNSSSSEQNNQTGRRENTY